MIHFRQDAEYEIEKSKRLNWLAPMIEEYCSMKCMCCLEHFWFIKSESICWNIIETDEIILKYTKVTFPCNESVWYVQ
jgi:hypothetical protein